MNLRDAAIDAPDDFYEALLKAHEGLDTSASAALNARLVLLLAAEIGQQRRLCELIAMAKADDAQDHD
ncbi:hypothetical protein IP84_15870 [beta proteobacterium AAP99]|nr:hypothetical protein IP84_15870 [beta proteobacterium AAP99]